MHAEVEANPIRFSLDDLFNKHELDLIWIKGLFSIKYIAGFTGSTAQLLVNGDGKKWMLVDSRYTTQSKEECKSSKVIEIKKPMEELCEQVRALGAKRLGFEANEATFSDYQVLKKELPGVELVPLSENLASLRIVKTPDEIDKLKNAIAIATRAFDELVSEIHVGWTENEAAWFMEKRFREYGATGMSFDTLICSGPRSAIVHGKPSHRKFEKGDFIIIDRGVIADHYISDETNTFVLGKADSKQKEVYQVVKDAHDYAIGAVKPGMKCVDIDAIAREYIHQKGFGQYFGHGTGHGVGIEVHELPIISPRGEGVLEEGMAFSVEPGIYIPDWGGVRIEDLVVVTANGCELMTTTDKSTYELKVD